MEGLKVEEDPHGNPQERVEARHPTLPRPDMQAVAQEKAPNNST